VTTTDAPAGSDPADVTGLTVEVTYRFDADVTTVWALLSDLGRMAGLGPEHVEVRWEDPPGAAGPAAGARFVGCNRMGGREWEVPCTVVAVEAPTHLAWTVLSPDEPSSTWTYDLRPDGDGTVVVQRFAHGPGFSYLRAAVDRDPDHAAQIMASRAETLRTNMETTFCAAAELLAGSG
jgi:uncharacterized protein YndB with AHSA1/START domain